MMRFHRAGTGQTSASRQCLLNRACTKIEKLPARPFDVIAVEQPFTESRNHPAQLVLAIRERKISKVLPINREQVERILPRFRRHHGIGILPRCAPSQAEYLHAKRSKPPKHDLCGWNVITHEKQPRIPPQNRWSRVLLYLNDEHAQIVVTLDNARVILDRLHHTSELHDPTESRSLHSGRPLLENSGNRKPTGKMAELNNHRCRAGKLIPQKSFAFSGSTNLTPYPNLFSETALSATTRTDMRLPRLFFSTRIESGGRSRVKWSFPPC